MTTSPPIEKMSQSFIKTMGNGQRSCVRLFEITNTARVNILIAKAQIRLLCVTKFERTRKKPEGQGLCLNRIQRKENKKKGGRVLLSELKKKNEHSLVWAKKKTTQWQRTFLSSFLNSLTSHTMTANVSSPSKLKNINIVPSPFFQSGLYSFQVNFTWYDKLVFSRLEPRTLHWTADKVETRSLLCE